MSMEQPANMKNGENHLRASELSKTESEDLRKKLYPHACDILNHAAVREESFRSMYGNGVGEDLQCLKKLTLEHDLSHDQNYQWSQIFEALLYEQAGKQGWFDCDDQETRIIRPSKYDDVINKVDLIAQMKSIRNGALSHLALGMDATFGEYSIQPKLTDIKKSIDSGKLTGIKYFDDGKHYHGSLRKIPRVIVGIGKELVQEIALLWANKDEQSLKNHPVQVLILKQILRQLRTFMGYAEDTGKTEIAKIFEEEIDRFEKLIQSKKGIDWTHLADDPVHHQLLIQLQMFNRE